MKKIIFGISLLVISILLIGSIASCGKKASNQLVTTTSTSPIATQQKIVLRFGTPGPAEHPGTLLMIKWAENFTKAAGGKYEIKVFAGGALGGSLDQMNAIRTGAIDLGDAATNFYAPDDAAFDVMDVPFLFESFDAQVEFTKLALPIWDKISQEKFNQKLLIPFVYGHKDVYSVNKPIKTLEDWKGLLVSINTNLESNVITALGAAPVVIDWVDELPSLQKGLINAGTLSSLAGLYPMGYADVCKYYTYAYMKGGAGIIGINLDVWNSMPKDMQDLLISTGWDYTNEFNSMFKSNEEGEWIDGIQAQGMTVYTLPPAERDRWIGATRGVTNAYWASLPSDIAKKFQEYAAQANAKYPFK